MKAFGSAGVALMLLGLLAGGPGAAAEGTRIEHVQFKKGSSSAVVESSITGYQQVDYVLGARAGQTMNVSMATRHGATYFNILAPGESTVAMFTGAISGNQYEGTLPTSGNYTIRVYMMRSAARRNEVAPYRLEMIVTGAGSPRTAAPHDAKVAGAPFHAVGTVPCAQGKGQPAGTCAFGVERLGGGDAHVTVKTASGAQRVILFEKGQAAGYDARVGGKGAFSASRQADLTIVHIGEERYEIPDAVIDGG